MSEIAGVVDALIKAGRPARDVSEWGKPFLKGVRRSGNISRSARKARVSPTTVRKYVRAHPDFARRVAAALYEYGDALEENLGILAFKGNAIANISRLKALNKRLASKYSEKAVDARVLNLTVNNTQIVTESAAQDLLRRSIAQATPATLAILGAGAAPVPAIIDAEVEPNG